MLVSQLLTKLVKSKLGFPWLLQVGGYPVVGGFPVGYVSRFMFQSHKNKDE